jgi:hypothetical protein
MPRDCTYNGRRYSDGSQVCQEGEIHRCDDGQWTNLHFACGNAGSPDIQGLARTDAYDVAASSPLDATATPSATPVCPLQPVTGRATKLQGSHKCILHNTSDQPQTFRLEYLLTDSHGHRFSRSESVVVQAGKTMEESAVSFLNVVYEPQHIGTVKLTVSTIVTGAAESAATGHCSFPVQREA